MAVVFGNLCAIKRENQVFYCVSEARRKLFSRVSDMALNDWVNSLSVNILNASDEESKILEKQFGTEPGPFLLISESDLIRLFNVNRSPFTGTLFPFPSHVCTAVPDSLRQNSNESTSTIDSRNDNLVHSVNTVTSPRSKSQGYTVGSPRADQCANQTLQRVQTPAKNETVSIGDPFFPGREENSEIAASATENCKAQPKPDQDGTETRRKTDHFNAGESDLIRLFNVNRSPFTGTLFPFPSHVCTAVPDSLRQNSNESTSTIDSRNDNLVHSVNTVTSPRSKSQGYTVGSPRADQCANQTLQRVQTPAKNETVSIGDPFFPGREENSEIAASATENCKTQPKPDQDGTETRRNTGHFNAGESEENTDSQGLSQEKNRSDQRKSHVLTHSEMTPQLRSDMKKVRRFFSQELNLNRQGGPLQPSTLNKIIERVAGFLWYVKYVRDLEPGLSLCGNPSLVQEFIQFVTEQRNLKAITASRYISSFLSVVKVLNADEHSSSVCMVSIEKLRTIQRQLETTAKKQRLAVQATKPYADKKIVYPEILELCRELKWRLDELSGIDQARCGMNLCLLLLYCSANPGRVKEYVTLRLSSGQSPEQCRDQNFICFNDQDDTVVLLEGDYKTKSTYGPNYTSLTELPFLTYYLKLYRQTFRPKLLMGKTHDYFFVNQKGSPFTEASYSNYISTLFDKHFSVKLTTNDLRKCVIDYFLSLPQSGDYSLRESLAAVMKHSVRTQKRHYDERPLAEKKARAIDFLGGMASRAMESEEIEILSDEDDDGYLETLPSNGELVALVASNSTLSNPEVFVAKVLKFSQDRKTVFLAHFTEVEPCKFKLEAGKSYRESAKSIIYPVDIEYHYSSGIYELRTPKLDIHNQVRPKT